VHYTFIFNTFVFLQLFNEINSRKVNEELNVFDHFFENWLFSTILVGTIGFQILMVEVFGSFADTTGLSWSLWICSIVIGFFSIPFGFFVRVIPVNSEWGRISIPEDTFLGAKLEGCDDDTMHSNGHSEEKDRLVKSRSSVEMHRTSSAQNVPDTNIVIEASPDPGNRAISDTEWVG